MRALKDWEESIGKQNVHDSRKINTVNLKDLSFQISSTFSQKFVNLKTAKMLL